MIGHLSAPSLHYVGEHHLSEKVVNFKAFTSGASTSRTGPTAPYEVMSRQLEFLGVIQRATENTPLRLRAFSVSLIYIRP